MSTHPFRWIGHLAVLVGAATACVPTPKSEGADAGGDPALVCHPADGGGFTCTCAPSFERGPTGQCQPSFSVLRVNGVDAVPLRGPDGDQTDIGDQFTVDVPRGTDALVLEAATESPGYAPIIDGVASASASAMARLPFPEPERRVVSVALASEAGARRTASLLIRRSPRFRVVAQVEHTQAGSVALTGDGHTIAGGAPTFSLLSSHNGGTIVTARDDGGLDPAQAIGPATDTLGWTVALSDDAQVLASANPSSAPPLSVFERGPSRWEPARIDGLPDGGGTGAVAMTRDGRHVLFSAPVSDGGAAIYDTTSSGPGRWLVSPLAQGFADSLAISSDGNLVAAGSVTRGGVQLLERQGQGLVATERLSRDAGSFGSSLAMSDDGVVLVVSARASTAWIYERTDAGYVERATIAAPGASASSQVDKIFEAPVSVSGDGRRVAVGFPGYGTVAVAARADGGWAIIDWVHVPNEVPGFFGNGVSLSANGRRLGLAAYDNRVPSGLLFLEDSEP